MRLPLDVALCDGNGEAACEFCVRRMADRGSALRWWTAPMATADGCPEFIEPPRYTITDKGRALLGDKP